MSRITNKEACGEKDAAQAEEYYMRIALAAAKRCAARDEVPVGAMVVKEGRVLARCGNTREGAHDPTGHAEINALRRAAKRLGGWNLHDCELYVTLEPCAMCAGACVNARIKRIVFGAYDGKGGACGGVTDITGCFCHRPEVKGGVLETECAALLKEFFRAKRITEAKRRGRQEGEPAAAEQGIGENEKAGAQNAAKAPARGLGAAGGRRRAQPGRGVRAPAAAGEEAGKPGKQKIEKQKQKSEEADNAQPTKTVDKHNARC